MTLIKWNPIIRPTLFNEIDSWFNNISSEFSSAILKDIEWKPSFEVLNTNNSYHLRADLPGMVKKDVDIEVVNDLLTISGERKNKNDLSENNNHYSELSYGKFARSFNLPDDVKQDCIKATMKDGVLALEIPRMKKNNPDIKKIAIK